MGKRRKHRNQDHWLRTEYGGMPMWGLIASVVGFAAMGVVALVYVLMPADATSQPSAGDRPVPTITGEPRDELFTVAILGDSYTAGTQYGGLEENNWSRIMTVDDGIALGSVSAQGGSGFVAPGQFDQPFTDPDRIATVTDADSDLILVVIAANDAGTDQAELESAVRQTLTPIQETDVPVVVVGPIWRAPAETSRAVVALNASIEAVANDLGVTHIDAMDWLVDRPELIAEDGAHPTDAGHEYLAERIEDALAGFLPTSSQ